MYHSPKESCQPQGGQLKFRGTVLSWRGEERWESLDVECCCIAEDDGGKKLSKKLSETGA